jgi:hypothetical protein
VERISPPAHELLEKLGITFSYNTRYDKDLHISYTMNWRPTSPVQILTEERQGSVSERGFVIDADSGKALNLRGGRGSSRQGILSREISAGPLAEGTNRILFKSRTLFAMLEAPEFAFDFKMGASPETVSVKQKFIYDDVEFMIEEIVFDKNEFTVRYSQLTPPAEVGVYQLSFAFDDRLGHVWRTTPDVKLAVRNPKEYTMTVPNTPSKNWTLLVEHVVLVIPGIETEITVREE